MRHLPPTARFSRSGFTLIEVMNSVVLSALILGAGLTSYILIYRAWFGVDARVRADQDINMAMSQMVYGVDGHLGLRAAAARKITLVNSTDALTLNYQAGGASKSFVYDRVASNLVFNPGARILCRDVSDATITKLPQTLIIMLQVDRMAGNVHVRRQIGTQIELRNQ